MAQEWFNLSYLYIAFRCQQHIYKSYSSPKHRFYFRHGSFNLNLNPINIYYSPSVIYIYTDIYESKNRSFTACYKG